MRRVARYGAFAIGAIVVLLVAAVIVIPELLDRPAMAARLQARISAAVGGEVRWQEFSIRILPFPRAMLRGLEVKTAAATITTDEASAALRLWPLFFGRAEIASAKVARPVVRLTIVPAAAVPKEARIEPAPRHALEAYRATMATLVRTLQNFAPDTDLEVDRADISIRVEGMPPIEASNLIVQAHTSSHGVELEASAASRYWNSMKLAGKIEYADLSSSAELHLARVEGQAWLDWLLKSSGISVAVPNVDLSARFRGDAAKALELDIDSNVASVTLTRGPRRIAAAPVVIKAKLVADANEVALHLANLGAGASTFGNGAVRYTLKDKGVAGDIRYDLDLPQALGYAREFAPKPLERIESLTGMLHGRVELALRGQDRNIGITIEKSDAALQVKELPGPILLTEAAAQVDTGSVSVKRAVVSMPAGNLTMTSGRYAFKDRAAAAAVDFDLGVAPTLALVRAVLPEKTRSALDIVDSSEGRMRGSVKGTLAGKNWTGALELTQSDAAVQVKKLPGPIRLIEAAAQADASSISVKRAVISMPAGKLAMTSGRYSFKDRAAAAAVDYDLGLAPTLALVRAVLPEKVRSRLDIVESAEGRMRGSVKGTLAGKNWTGALELTQSDARAQVKGMPGPVSLTRASVRATPKTIDVGGATVKFLDGVATASGILSDYTGNLRVQASVPDATVGPKALAWVSQAAKIPPNLELKAPIHVTVRRFGWAAKAPVEVHAEARFESGPAVGAELTWSPELLDLRHASIKDRMSDVTVAVRRKGGSIEGSYSGRLDSRTFGAMLKNAAPPAGAIDGDLRFSLDRADRRRNTAIGTLKGENVDLSWLAGAPAFIDRIDIESDGKVLRLGESTVNWAGQRATLRGEVKRGPNGPIIEASIESPGVLVDALLPKRAATAKPAADTPATPAKPAAKEEKASTIWPLPVTGHIKVHSQSVQYTHYKVEPLSADIVLEGERAVLDVQEALVCGFAVPLTVEATPKGISASVQVAAQKQKLEEAVHCLAGGEIALTGVTDLRLDVRAQGKPNELVKNLKGTVTADVRNGMVMKFALLGNILSLQNVVAVVQGGSKLGSSGFPFRQLAAKGHFDKGRFFLDEGVFYSDAVGLGANGWISLTDYQSRLTVLVAPLALLNEGVRKLPVLGYVVGGSLTSLPVGVSGDIRDPLVVPLGPGAITDGLVGIVSRTLSLPGKAVGAAGGQKQK